jgi:hypothetical protein
MTPARRTLLLVGLLAASASLVAWDRTRTPQSLVAEAAVRNPPATFAPPAAATSGTANLAMPRERGDYQGQGVDAFPSLLPPPPPQSATTALPVSEAPRPVAPALPFIVIGKKLEGDEWEVYLARGDQTYIAKQGGELAGDYRVDAISPTQMTLIYLPLNEKQTLQTGASLHE